MDIVWFMSNKAEQAMRTLVVPWPEAEWHERRGKMHPFRSWREARPPGADGSPLKTLPVQCVCIDYPGSVRLSPSSIKDKKLCIAEHLTDIQEIAPGLIGAKIKPETWQRPEFVEAAQKQEAREQRAKENVAKFTGEEQFKALSERKSAIKRYLLALAHSRRLTWRTPDMVLQDIVLIDQLEEEKQDTISLDEWLNAVAPMPTIPDRGEYDPVSFLAHAAMLFAKVHKQDLPDGVGNAQAYLDRNRSNLVGAA